MDAVIQILSMVVNAIILLVIIQMVIGLLFAFNVISGRNEFLHQIYRSIGLLLDPLLGPIKRFMPDTGAIDFSPLVLILILNALIYILAAL